MSKMINFRLPDDEAALLDAAVEAAGTNRSFYIRDAINKKIKQIGGTPVANPKRAPRGSSKEHECVLGTPGKDCAAAQWVNTLTGLKECTTCHIKRR